MMEKTTIISFTDLEQRQKLFEDQLIDLLNSINTIEFQCPLPQKRKEISKQTVKELYDKARQQKEKQKQLLQEHKEYTNEIEALEGKIGDLEAELKELQQAVTVSRSELKQATKPLSKAIQKYSSILGMEVEVRSLEDNQFVASVTFTGIEEGPRLEFIIDRKRRSITDFRASWLMSDDEAKELKAQAMAANGLKASIPFKAIRKLCI